jgi:AraC-like DNA-binding protein
MTDNYASFRYSSADLSERDRIPFLREVAGRSLFRVDIEPLSDAVFHADVSLRAMPGLGFLQSAMSGMSHRRTPELIADGNDAIALVVNLSGPAIVSFRDQDFAFGDGDAFLMAFSEVSGFTRPIPGRSVNLCVPRRAVAGLVANVDDKIMRPVRRDNQVLKLLMGYVSVLEAGAQPADAVPQHLIVDHVHDLMALLIGATPDATALAEGRGVRAARLRAIKDDIIRNIGGHDLSVDAVAARQQISPGYVRKLLEIDGTTFTDIVSDLRLLRAYRMLTNPRFADRAISSIAFEAGFGHLSYFNRVFRRRFGGTPSEIRAATRQNDES